MSARVGDATAFSGVSAALFTLATGSMWHLPWAFGMAGFAGFATTVAMAAAGLGLTVLFDGIEPESGNSITKTLAERLSLDLLDFRMTKLGRQKVSSLKKVASKAKPLTKNVEKRGWGLERQGFARHHQKRNFL